MRASVGAARPTDLHQVSINWQRLRVAINPGKRGCVPLLLMNGLGVNLEFLGPFVEKLDTEREIIRFDVPGIGGSPLPCLPYSFPLLASLVASMLDHLDYTQVDVLGFSWGGQLAQQFALQHSRRCRRLILSNTATGAIMVPGHLFALAELATPQRFTEPSYLREVDPELTVEGARAQARALREVAPALQSGGLGYLYQLWAIMGWTSLPWLLFIRQPTMIISGNKDPIVPAINAQIMRGLIPHSQLYLYNGGHMGMLTHTSELANVVEQFLSSR